MKRKICAAIALISFLWIIGLAGASDCDTMELTSIIKQLLIAAPMFFISIYVGGI